MDDSEVPVAWLSAETGAEDLIALSAGRVSPATFEFRATRDVLALTLFLTAGTSGVRVSTDRLHLLHRQLAVTTQWLVWCQAGLLGTGAAGGEDLRMARSTWRWLERGRLLPAVPRSLWLSDHVAGAACGLGLALGRQVVHQRLHDR
jgi:hypothetical protein